MDQLRTLLAVFEEGTALAAARLLGREQSSVQKQLDTLNRNLGEHCGEPLLHKRGRGERVAFSAAGEALARLARDTLGEWRTELDAARLRSGRTLAVGSTRYTLGYLLDAVEQVRDRLLREGVELRMEHVRTSGLLGKLRSGELDLVCGSVLTPAAAGPAGDARFEGLEVMEWRRSGLGLVTNQPVREPSGQPVRVGALARTPLVVPADGIVPDALRAWFGAGYRRRIRVAAEIDSAHYGFELLGSGVIRGSMLVTQGLAEAVAEGRLPEAAGLRTLRLRQDVGSPQQVLVGAFRRRDAPTAAGPEHPVGLLWDALAREHARLRAGSGARECAGAQLSHR
ncbi:LysR family transcriptional regulator [Streptomyces sp. SB3404]|uniref:LysR family transcriptional regulator n=2 Tax=Streptomyces boncukensis TaxID=2711219 RepID=A0A6G4WWF6_9ACTN|nr:LysR family transcriptional regulator [Streptomyces boncukensis]